MDVIIDFFSICWGGIVNGGVEVKAGITSGFDEPTPINRHKCHAGQGLEGECRPCGSYMEHKEME